jgi:hypothetical protein
MLLYLLGRHPRSKVSLCKNYFLANRVRAGAVTVIGGC